MNNGEITYAQLTEKLARLGYRQTRKTLQGKSTRIYEHHKIEDATMFLPDGGDQEVVPAPLVGKVLLILRTYGLVEKQNALLA